MYANKVFYEDQQLENERLELTAKNTLYYLGRKLTLRNCTLVLKVSARNLFIRDVRFIDCAFDVKQELKNHQEWIRVSLKGCRFKGKLTGCDFGYWPEYGSEPEYQLGSIEDCDFTEARLDGCRFMGGNPTSLRFPRWPCFTILDPIGRADELCGVQWPGAVGPIVFETLRRQPPTTVALTEHAHTVARRCDTTPEALRAALERFDFILC